MKYQKPLEEYIQFYETMTPRTLSLLDHIAARDVFFKNPFHAVRGINSMRDVLSNLFDQIENPVFKVTDHGWGKDGQTVYLRWSCSYGPVDHRRFILGVSDVMFDMEGRVVSHTDYWDAAEQFYEKMPVLGLVLKNIRKKISG